MFSNVNAALFVSLALIAGATNVVYALAPTNISKSFSMQASAGGITSYPPIYLLTKTLPLSNGGDTLEPVFYERTNHSLYAGQTAGWNGWAQVLYGDIPVEIIYYCDFSVQNTGGFPYINDFFNRLSGRGYGGTASSWWQVVQKYYNLSYNGANPSRQYVGNVFYDQSVNYDCRNYGDKLCGPVTGIDIQSIITDSIVTKFSSTAPTVGYERAAYFVVLGSTIIETYDGEDQYFGNHYCGYHSTYLTPSNLPRASSKYIRYGVVRINDGTKGCLFFNQPAGGNKRGIQQNVIFQLAHELVEIITDPNPIGMNASSSAWRDKNFREVMDKCESFSPSMIWQNSELTDGNPGFANTNINGMILTLPAIWDPVLQKCVGSNLGGSPWKNIGCFKDSGTPNRALLPMVLFSHGPGTMTNERCQANCAAGGYIYAGTEAGGECWCSNNYPNQGTASNCNTPCTADPSSNCGGAFALNVWQFGGGSNMIKSHTRDNFCIDQPLSNTTNGVKIQLWDCNGSSAQKLTYISSDQSIRIQNGDRCLDVGGASFAGGRVQQWTCNGTPAQKFIMNPADRTIRWAVDTNLCFDVHNAISENGANLQLWFCGTRNPYQAWHIVS